MKITIRNLKDRKTFDIDVQPTSTAADMKDLIESHEGLPANSQRLVFGGKPLKEGVPLHELGVQKGATLHLVLRLKTYLELKVRVMNGRTIDLDANPKAPVMEVRNNVYELLTLDDRPRVLCFEGQRLDEAMPLDQAHVKDGSTLHLILVPLPNLPSLYTDAADRARIYGMAGSLYARCGGIFGVAGFVDRCMDAWMADPTLNANDAVATWHQRAQRCGFKFLVTQLMGYLCGGPQVYTGRDMATSHKHLAINDAQWGAFIATLGGVCDELSMLAIDMNDLLAVIQSMRPECVLQHGERAPPNPGREERGNHVVGINPLYMRLGGVCACHTSRPHARCPCR